MEKPSLDNKVLTENPLLDEIIYNVRQLATETVLKDLDKAENAETDNSVKNGDLLVAIANGYVQFSYFHYDEEFLRSIPGISEENIKLYAADNNLIPESIRPLVLSKAKDKFTENYVEENNYYRMLHGLPDYDPTGVWEGIWIDVNTIQEGSVSTSLSPYYVKVEGTDYQPIHELDVAYIEILYSNGTIDAILNNTTRLTGWGLTKDDVLYLKHLGARSIDYVDARRGGRFSMLYCPSSDSTEVQARYMDIFEANRLYMLYTSYSEAYKYQSDYYDNFCMIFLIIQTIIDMLIEIPEYIIRRDVFDARTCQYIFESQGVEYFPDIPLKYQIALVKNLNKLIKFKSSDKCIVDIVSIFGIKNIEIFKYYILKDRNISSGDIFGYSNKTKDVTSEEGTETIEDNDENYDLKFVKVPLGESYDDYIRTPTNIYDYDTIIDGDAYWNGDKDYDSVKSAIKNMDFTLLRSKYYSVEALIDLTERNFSLIYFTNILLYNQVDKSQLLVNLPNISTKKQFELVDVIIALYSISYIYYGAEDTILDSQEKIANILGFNMEADLAKIADHLYENHGRLSFKDLHIDQFTIPPNDEILSFEQLEEIYMTNKDILVHVREQMSNPALKKEIYDAYKFIYQSLFVMRCNMEYYSLPNGEMATTYRQFLRYKDPVLYEYIQNKIASIKNVEARQTACVNAIQSITTYLKDYIDQDLVNLDDVFAGLPSISLDFIRNYVQEVVDFFKSFKIFTHDSSILYLFDDKFQNYVILRDWILLKYLFDKSEVVKIEDYINKMNLNMSKKERVEIFDKLWISIDTWIQKHYDEYYESERYKEFTKVIRDYKEFYSTFDIHDTSLEEKLALDAIVEILVDLTLSSKMNYIDIDDSYILDTFHDLDDYYNEWMEDLIALMIVDLHYNDRYHILDEIDRSSKLDDLRDWLRIVDGNGKVNTSITIEDKLKSNYQGTMYKDECYLIITNES